MLAVIVKLRLSPSIFPSLITDLPSISLVVSPVSLLPSTLKTKVRSSDPLGPSAVPFHVPAISAALAATAQTIKARNRRFMPTYFSTLPRQPHHRLDVKCLRKQIHQA